MPGVNPPVNEKFYAELAQMKRDIQALATQQQLAFTNAKSKPLLNLGLVPGSSPAQYGLQFLDPTTGHTVMFLGETSTGAAAVQFFDSAGNVRIQIDANGLHQYDSTGNQVLLLGTQVNGADGLGVYNGSTLEVLMGLINATPPMYGLAVLPYGGTAMQQVGGGISLSGLSVSGVSQTGWVTFPAPSTITAEVGPSGSVTIGGSFQLDTNTAGAQASVGVLIGGAGGGIVEIGQLFISGGLGTVNGVGAPIQWGNLSPGTHTFTAQYSTNGVGNCDMYGSFFVQPL